MSLTHYNLLVIGSGSGGLAMARRAAYHAKLLGQSLKIGIIERDIARMCGGTCVNVGCVPKKVMWTAASIADSINHLSSHYGFKTSGAIDFDFGTLVKGREIYIERLRGIYQKNLRDSGVELISGLAKFSDAIADKKIVVSDPASGCSHQLSADHIVVACGGTSLVPPDMEGSQHCIDSNGFFQLSQLPKSVIVIGAGYIAVELAGVLNSLGSKTTLCVRRDKPLSNFDSMISDELFAQMRQNGIEIVTKFVPQKIHLCGTHSRILTAKDGRTVEAECVLLAIGRSSRDYLSSMNVPASMMSQDGHHLEVDEFQNTKVPGIYAVGDVIGKAALTPVAIAAGRRLSDRLFANMTDAKISYENIPTVVFSHPPIGTVGLTEDEARKQFAQVKVYTSSFVNSLYGILPIDGPPKPKSRMKMICEGETERVVGLHCIGDGADELLQGFAVALQMGATKSNFDSCIAIHPTAAEEFVTMAPWGLQ